MFRPMVILKKYLFVKPKWRLLVIFTKKIPRHKLETLKKVIEKEMSLETDFPTKEYLRGKREILELLLK